MKNRIIFTVEEIETLKEIRQYMLTDENANTTRHSAYAEKLSQIARKYKVQPQLIWDLIPKK